MKTFKLITLTICFMLAYEVSGAKQQDSKAEKLTMNYALQAYVDAISLRQVERPVPDY